jgi:hypothetical protein
MGIFLKNNAVFKRIRMREVCVAENRMGNQRYMCPFCFVVLPNGSCPERYHSHITLAHSLLTVNKKTEASTHK